MRKLNFFLLSVLFFALTFSSCKKRDDDKTDSEKTAIENNSGNSEVTSEKVTVIFNTDGATGAVEPQTVEKGTKITLPLGEGMKKDGYKFLGWSLTENGEIITEYTVNENEVTLFAVWEQVIFTVKFDTDGGSGEFASQTIEKGKTVTKPESKPEKNGFIFDGWNYNNSEFDFSVPITTDVIITAKWIEVPENCVSGLFSVSDDKKIFFSKGNLQYHCRNKEWRFAPNQYDRICYANENISANYNGYIDLFGWGMWLRGQNPFQWVENNSIYLSNITTKGENFTGISVIGEEWVTLTLDEWLYLKNRSEGEKIGIAEIDGVQGLVILPDEWTLPNDITFNSGFVANYTYSYDDKNYYTFEKVRERCFCLLPALATALLWVVSAWTVTIGRLRRAIPRERSIWISIRALHAGATTAVTQDFRFGWCGLCRINHISEQKNSEIVRNNGFAVFVCIKIFLHFSTKKVIFAVKINPL